jgi:diguanylate cyclase
MPAAAVTNLNPKDDAALEGSRFSLLIALPLTALAFVVAMVLNPLSGQATPYDTLVYPTMMVVMILMQVVLLFFRRSTNLVMLLTLAGSSAFFISKLIYVLFFGPADISLLGEITETFFWVPAIYVLSQYTVLPGFSRVLPFSLLTMMALISAIYVVSNLLGGHPDFSVILALAQMNMAQMSLLAASYMLLGYRTRYIQADTYAETMHVIAHSDQLTGLANRLGVQVKLEQMVQASGYEHGNRLAVVFLNVDGFKSVNDLLGSSIGDDVLREVARRWHTFCRDADCLGRWNGDEFVAIFDDVTGEEATAIAYRLTDALSAPLMVAEHLVQLTASAGVSAFPEDGLNPHELIRHAESALDTSKRSGKNKVRRFSPEIEGEIEERQRLESDLRLALERNELELAYQPIVNLNSGETIKAEALLRWKHPTRGMVSPMTFIPIAESSGLIVPLGNWILFQACTQAKNWNQPGRPEVRVAVNISAIQLGHPDFCNVVAQTLIKTGLPARMLELELTEGTILRDVSEAQRTLRELRELGISLAIDDFGTGYSSLSYLRDLPIQTIKIDRSFINDLCSIRHGPQFALALIEAILSIARTLDLEVVAEGIEDESQLMVLRSLGCGCGQGYYFARPDSGHALEQRLRSTLVYQDSMPNLN